MNSNISRIEKEQLNPDEEKNDIKRIKDENIKYQNSDDLIKKSDCNNPQLIVPNNYNDLSSILLKREQLKTIRNQLFDILKQEEKTLQDYSSLEINQQHRFNILRDCCRKAPIPSLKNNQKYIQINNDIDEIFENMMQQYDENKKLREKIISSDHHNFIKINEEQNRGSDERFKIDNDRLIYEKLKREHDLLKLENQELKELSESIHDEYIGLNTQQKHLEDELARITLQIDSQKKKFDSLTEKYIEYKQKNDILNQEREKREIVYRKRVEEALRQKDEQQKCIDEIQKKQKEVDLKIEKNSQIIGDLSYNYDRLNSEIIKLSRMYQRRREQQGQYNQILST